MRASHGINAFNLIHNMPYGSPNLFQNLNQHHHDQTSTLNPYAASRQFGFGCEFVACLHTQREKLFDVSNFAPDCRNAYCVVTVWLLLCTLDGICQNIFAPNWPAQQSIQNTTGLLIINQATINYYYSVWHTSLFRQWSNESNFGWVEHYCSLR